MNGADYGAADGTPTGPLNYRAAGVDIAAGEAAKQSIRKPVESTYTSGVRGVFGAFGGMYRVPEDVEKPVLVSSTDGVGTKIKLAIEANRHEGIGHDLVNHCVNDILVQGAIPLFFLDYVAFGKLDQHILYEIVSGLAAGCRENRCALLGGETAEMPDVYQPPDYDLAGFIVGCVSEDAVLSPARVRAGDVLIGLASSGLHTNGYSLARRILSDVLQLGPEDEFPGDRRSVADAALAVHVSYLGALRPVLDRIHAMAHITGGGIPGNLSRAIPPELDAVVVRSSWTVPPLFRELRRAGQLSVADAFMTFNMGVGMIVICDASDADAVIQSASSAEIAAWGMGTVRPGTGRVILDLNGD